MIRLALVGAGAHGYAHARAIEALRHAGRDVRVQLVVDPAIRRAAALAGAFDVPHWGAPELLERVPVDAVDVCSPTDTHHSIAETCVRLGKPALIEKPLAPTLAQADRMLTGFAAAGVPLLAGHSTRFDPALRRLAAVVSEGTLGRVGLVAIHHHQGYAWADGWRAWQSDADRSGGRIVHLGIHDVDLACWLAGAPPVEVRAIGRPEARGRRGAWASYVLQATFANGALALVTGSWEVVPPNVLRKTCLVVGSEGRVRHDSGRDELAALPSAAPEPVGYAASLRDQLDHWLDCLEGRAVPIVAPEQARTSLAVALAAERSASSDGARVKMEAVLDDR